MLTLRGNEGRLTAPRLTAILYTGTIFLSASLLFFVEPLFTKIVLPAIGGAPAVWTTAMLFFQSVLIAGYVYAHLMTRHVPVRAQIGVHLALWALALWFLPLALPEGWRYDADRSTVIQTLLLFALGVGVPFAMLSANAPLVQFWYARSNGPSADDPYFLYGASNLGSLMSLLAFPLVAEPLFRASEIDAGWARAFMVLGPLLLLCGLRARGRGVVPGIAPVAAPVAEAAPTVARIGLWVFLAFIPSSLMLGATTKISIDLGSFPLVWVVPLALYLLTFVLTFTNRPPIGADRLRSALRAALLVLAVLTTGVFSQSLSWTQSALLIVAVFAVSLAAHRALYEARPGMRHLTLFYVVMSVGGALGGLFNSILGPTLFDGFYELRITVALAALLLIRTASGLRRADVTLGILIGLAALAPLVILVTVMQAGAPRIQTVAVMAVLLAATLRFAARGGALALGIVVFVAVASGIMTEPSLFRDRSFFGVHRVTEEGGLRLYSNGTTIHGAERIAELGAARPGPITYYHEKGPLAQVMQSAKGMAAGHVGIVGLGVGAMACYRQPGQAWDFYEIDRVVDRIARDPRLFTFISRCAPESRTHLGDARIVLREETDAAFDILVIDAYSSDAVPVHLTTAEAVALYRDRLRPGGVLVFHISNRHYRIDVPLARIADALGMAAMIQFDRGTEGVADGHFPSTVVIMARQAQDLAGFAADPRWEPLKSDGGRVWTDDYANLLAILR